MIYYPLFLAVPTSVGCRRLPDISAGLINVVKPAHLIRGAKRLLVISFEWVVAIGSATKESATHVHDHESEKLSYTKIPWRINVEQFIAIFFHV